MEIMRDQELSFLKDSMPIKTNKYGTYEEYKKFGQDKCPIVFKKSNGSSSRGVFLIVEGADRNLIKKETFIFSFFNFKMFMKSIFDEKRSKKISNNRKKFITQNYIRGLPGDYKILFYGKKAFVTKRNNRKNDFRASGSGDFSFVNSGIDDVLDFAWSVFSHFDVPYMGLDISKKGKSFVLIEFQFLRFSNIPLQGSEGYFIKNKKWEFVEDENDLELIFCKAVDSYICKKWKDISM